MSRASRETCQNIRFRVLLAGFGLRGHVTRDLSNRLCSPVQGAVFNALAWSYIETSLDGTLSIDYVRALQFKICLCFLVSLEALKFSRRTRHLSHEFTANHS